MKDLNGQAVRRKVMETKTEIWRDRKSDWISKTLVRGPKDLRPGFTHRLECVRRGNEDKQEMSAGFSHGATLAKTDGVSSLESCKRA